MVRAVSSEEGWLDLDHIAGVCVTSESPEYPVESILLDDAAGWRAAVPGTQLITIILDAPRPIRRIQLHFSEPDLERTQEFVLQWASAVAGERKELLRQQWNFSPHGSIAETEDIRVDLNNVLVLELVLNPDIRNGAALGTLKQFRMR
jgi:hypothetical protein